MTGNPITIPWISNAEGGGGGNMEMSGLTQAAKNGKGEEHREEGEGRKRVCMFLLLHPLFICLVCDALLVYLTEL